MVKKFKFAIFMAMLFTVFIFFTSCAGAPEIPKDLCSQYDAEKSILLKVAAIKQIPVNEIYYGLLDIAAIGMATGKLNRDKLADFMNDLADWYNKNYPLSYQTLINYMVDQEQAMQLAGIVSRRIGDFRSYLIVSQYDDCLLRAGWKEAMSQLFLERRE